MNYTDILDNIKSDHEKVLSSDRMRATSMVKGECYGMKAFKPGLPETYFLVRFISSGSIVNDKVLHADTNIKLSDMDCTDRYFVEIWDTETQEFKEYSAIYENKFLNIDLPEIGKKFVTFRRINSEYYESDRLTYNNTLTSKKTSDDIFWENHREKMKKLNNSSERQAIKHCIKFDTKEQFDVFLEWRDDYINFDENSLSVTYPLYIRGKEYCMDAMIQKLIDIGMDVEKSLSFFYDNEFIIKILKQKYVTN